MRFQTQVKKLTELGFKTFVTVDYFFFFADNQGKSVRELANGDLDEYQKSLRYFKLLSTGTKNEPGMELFTTEVVPRPNPGSPRASHVNAVVLTEKGRQVYTMLQPPVTRSMRKKKASNG